MSSTLARWLFTSATAHAALFALVGAPGPAPSPATALRIELVADGQAPEKAVARSPSTVGVSPEQGRKNRRRHVSRDRLFTPPADREQARSNGQGIVASSPATAPGPRTPSPESREAAVRPLISRWLAEHFRYPPLARRRGIEGEVRLALRIEADGRLSQVTLARSSGHSLLDEAALMSARRIPPLTQMAALLAGSALDTVVPVRYRLKEG